MRGGGGDCTVNEKEGEYGAANQHESTFGKCLTTGARVWTSRNEKRRDKWKEEETMLWL